MTASWLHDWFSLPDGSVVTNLIASVVWVVPTWVIIWRKKVCRVPWCLRLGHHPVDGTTWKVCHHHHQPHHHLALFHRHRVKHPDRLGYGESHDAK